MAGNKITPSPNFKLLVNSIRQTHTALQQSAVNAINLSLTIRNWLIGYYIVEYEQKGKDRAKYGKKLLDELSKAADIKGLSETNLKVNRLFYLTYPQIGQSVTDLLKQLNPKAKPIRQSLTDELHITGNKALTIRQSVTDELQVPPEKLISKLSFTHLVQLLPIANPLKRTFYELECIKGSWSVRQLQRQINSLYFERIGMSKSPKKLSALVAKNAERIRPADVVKSVYAFEFLGLKAKEAVEETDLETALLDNLQEFFLEMGHGFCLEGRQKKILIGNKYYFIDLVFYHRILKCHVLIDLKVDEFNHSDAGQLNSYLGYYKKEMMQKNDNPPVGILLVTDKNDALAQYATAGMDKHLFVSKYLVELPGKQQLEDFVRTELKNSDMPVMDIKEKIQHRIQAFADGNPTDNAIDLFNALGYITNRRAYLDKPTFDEFKDSYISSASKFDEKKALKDDWIYVDLLFQLSKEEVLKLTTLFDEKKVVTKGEDKTVIESYLFFVIELRKKQYTRTELSQITREVNRLFPMPVMILFKHGNTLTFSIIDRRLHKKDDKKDVLKKVTQIKDINIASPHRAHIEILFDLSFDELNRKHPFSNFVELHEAWQKTLDIKELNKKFYKEIFNWYLWALRYAKFPQIRPDEKDNIKDEVHQSESLIRLLTRLLFCWFMKEKGLINENLFNEREVKNILISMSENETTYYKAILQNLFFATLNKPIDERKKINKGWSPGEYGDPLVYRYEELFKKPEALPQHFKDIPFLNGGLFDCLDKRGYKKENIKELRLDGFTVNPLNQPTVPNKLFFGEDKGIDLSGENEYNDKKKKNITVTGIIDLLSHYKFTIEESTPIEEEIALDPELLGRIFENLLASYSPETHTPARKLTGSFYTPPAIVNYMVDETLVAYLMQKMKDSDTAITEIQIRKLIGYNEEDVTLNQHEKRALLKALNECRILDPACGSGAFPMGMLHAMIHIIKKVDPENNLWLDMVVANFPDYMQKDVRKKLEGENWNYVRKIGIIQECIYGIDIQPIATQISKLRFFISLLVDQQEKPGKENRGFDPLPNLDFKIVTANTLIAPPESEEGTTGLFADNIDEFYKVLEQLTSRYFSTYKPLDKQLVKEKIENLINQKCAEKIIQIERKTEATHESHKKELERKYKELLDKKKNEIELWESYKNIFKYEAVKFFDTKYFFPNVKEGFDIVIGNPPYVDIKGLPKEDVKLYFQIFKTTENRINLYSIFIERGISLLNKKGSLAYIIPNSILINESYRKIRKYIINGVERIIKLPDSVFEVATIETIILFSKKESLNENILGIYFSNDAKIDFSNLTFNSFSRDEWKRDDDSRFSIFSDRETTLVLRKINNESSPLEKYVFTSLGITPYDKYKGHSEQLINNRQYHSLTKITKRYVPLISGKNIHSFYISDEIGEYLKYGDWLGAPREKKFFEEPKIIVRQIVSGSRLKIVAGYSEKPLYFTQIGFSLISKTDNKENLKFILALLNSSLISFYHKNKFLDTEKVVFQKILIANCKQLPVKEPENPKPIISLVDQILTAKAQNPSADTRALEKEIDIMVYHLYGLTYEEAKIIEPGLAMSEKEYGNYKF